jgi:hypothetical protein
MIVHTALSGVLYEEKIVHEVKITGIRVAALYKLI